VSGHRHEVRALADLHAPERLDRVAQHQRPAFVRHVRDFRNRLSHSDLVVHLHDGHEKHALVEFTRKQFQVETTVGFDRKHRQVDALIC
jgi:hypothetical protein